jgi:membrane protein implicated in regulation of membrane protease activity
MKKIGFLLLVVGFLAGAYATVLDIKDVNWQVFLVAALAAIAGLVMIKRAEAAHATSDEVLELNRGELRESLENIVREPAAFCRCPQQHGAPVWLADLR